MPRGTSTKERLWYEDAKYYFCYLSYTFKELHEKFHLAEKTLRTWAERDNWIEEKQRSYRDRMSIRVNLEKFCVLQLESLNKMIADDPGKEVSQSRLYTVLSAVKTAIQLQDYGKNLIKDAKEEDAADEDKPKKSPAELRQEIEKNVGLRI